MMPSGHATPDPEQRGLRREYRSKVLVARFDDRSTPFALLRLGPVAPPRRLRRGGRPTVRKVPDHGDSAGTVLVLKRAPGAARTLESIAVALLANTFGAVLPSLALAATPSPAAPPSGDPRGGGEGAGFAGDPVAAILLVLVLGFASVAVTAAYVRLTRSRERE